jgi:hypothetical protein
MYAFVMTRRGPRQQRHDDDVDTSGTQGNLPQAPVHLSTGLRVYQSDNDSCHDNIFFPTTIHRRRDSQEDGYTMVPAPATYPHTVSALVVLGSKCGCTNVQSCLLVVV